MEWIRVDDSTHITPDEQWVKLRDEHGGEVILKVADKSLWSIDNNGEFVPLEQSQTSQPDPESCSESCSETCADLAEIAVELHECKNRQSSEDNAAYLIAPTLLPTELIDLQSALCFVCGLTVADGSNETAEHLAGHWSNTFLSTLQTLVHKRRQELWTIDPPAFTGRNLEVRAWDAGAEKLRIKKSLKKTENDEWSDQLSIIMLETTLKSVQQLQTDIFNQNERRQRMGGCSGLTFTAFGPCDDGALRAILSSVGNLRACLVKKSMELVPLIPKGIGDLSIDYTPSTSKLHPRGISVSAGSLRTSSIEPTISCHISRGYGHVQLFGHYSGKSRFVTDPACDPLKRQPYIVFMDVNIEEDVMILCTDLAEPVPWSQILEIARTSDFSDLSMRVLIIKLFANFDN